MKLLALDTATEACSVALHIDGAETEIFALTPRRHSKDLLPMIERILAEAGLQLNQLDALAFGCGPGAFTGLRVATAMVQGLAFAVDLPVVPVSTLAALAQQGLRTQQANHVLSAIDARMGEVYWGAFAVEQGLMRLLGKEQVAQPSAVIVPSIEVPWFGIGTGWRMRDELNATVSDCVIDSYPHAQDIVKLAAADFALGKAVAAELAMPVYLRDKVALKTVERQSTNR